MDAEDKSNETGLIGGLIGIVIIIVLCIWVYNHWIKSEWQALYDDGATSQSMGTFDSKEACLEYIHEKGYGECGKNCESPKSISGFYKCQETAD